MTKMNKFYHLLYVQLNLIMKVTLILVLIHYMDYNMEIHFILHNNLNLNLLQIMKRILQFYLI